MKIVLTIALSLLFCASCRAETVVLTREQCRYLERMYPNTCILTYGTTKPSTASSRSRRESGFPRPTPPASKPPGKSSGNDGGGRPGGGVGGGGGRPGGGHGGGTGGKPGGGGS